jgi:anhydro-N-acetylmuramic acid kinase
MTTMTVLGLMSGTSMDGVDAAVLVTDGETIADFGPRRLRPYGGRERDILRAALSAATGIADRDERPPALGTAERLVTDAHGEAAERLLADHPGLAIDLVGFHGQTVLHAPERKLTVQIGDGPGLAKRLGRPVVFDLRAADVAAGGEGAPLVPVYHRALVARAGLAGTVAVVNIGGVANLTRVAADGSLRAGDTGPGNALLDDFVRARTGAAMDRDGALAASGTVDQVALARLLDDPWFARPMAKSLDRGRFSAEAVMGLSNADGAATLTAFTAAAIARGIAVAGGADRVVLVGGGASNPVLAATIAAAVAVPITLAADLGWSADFVEAEAFAFLAARSVRGLPITFPGTTGVARPTTGGRLARP